MILQDILAHGEKSPYALAYRCRKYTMDYGTLTHKARLWAFQLNQLVPASQPIAVFGHKQPEMLVSFLACGLSGHAYLPLDQMLPAQRLQLILKEAGTPPLLSFSPLPFSYPNLLSLAVSSSFIHETVLPVPVFPSVDDTCYLMFTSGTTGVPKGVKISYGNLENFIGWLKGRMCTVSGPVLNQAALSFDLSVADLYLSLTEGRCWVGLEKETQQSYPSLLSAVFQGNPSAIVSTPSFAALCLAEPKMNAALLSELKEWFFCGEPLSPMLAKRIFQRFPLIRIYNAYGPTECTCAVTGAEIKPEMCNWPKLPIHKVRTAAAGELTIRNSAGKPLAEGEEGELVITGPSVGEYFSDIQGGFDCIEEKRAYHTGDYGIQQNGYVYFIGRKDGQIKYKGYRLELGEIEAALLALPQVQQAVVVAKRNEEGVVRRLVAFVSSAADAVSLRGILLQQFPAYMVPHIQLLSAFPLTANGKADRKKLEEMA